MRGNAKNRKCSIICFCCCFSLQCEHPPWQQLFPLFVLRHVTPYALCVDGASGQPGFLPITSLDMVEIAADFDLCQNSFLPLNSVHFTCARISWDRLVCSFHSCLEILLSLSFCCLCNMFPPCQWDACLECAILKGIALFLCVCDDNLAVWCSRLSQMQWNFKAKSQPLFSPTRCLTKKDTNLLVIESPPSKIALLVFCSFY